MKKLVAVNLSIVFLLVSIISGCESVKNSNNTQRGAVIGAVGGAVIGGVLGNNIGKGGNGALGAVIGGLVGGVAGGLIGRKMDKQAREIKEQIPGAEVERVGEGIKLTLGENAVRFNFNKSSLTGDAKTNLQKLEKVFETYSDTDIKIYGYTDNVGSNEYNAKLSQDRALSVRQYLIKKGIVASRIQVLGMGEADPIESNDSDAGRAKNRRVEFAITANEKMKEDAKKEAGN